MKITSALAATAALVALSGGGPGPARGDTTPTTEYTLVDLGAVTAAPRSEATAMNDNGVVVGDSFAFGSPLAATVWRPDGAGRYTAETLPNVTGGSGATDVNDAGLIVGYSGQTILHGERAVLWRDGNVSELGFPVSGTGSGSVATAVNDSGNVVGYADGVGYERAGGSITAVGNSVFPQAINRGGQLTGRHFTPCCDFAFRSLVAGAAIVDLGTLGGPAARSAGDDINSSGVIVGASSVRVGTYFVRRAAEWQADTATDLGLLPGTVTDGDSEALAINDTGIVVGYSEDPSTDAYYHAAIWKDGKISDLNDLIPADSGMLLERATDINSKGQIVGIGYRLPVTPTGDDRVDAQHAFLLTPKCQAKDTTDTDGDGLPDCWETYGVDTDGDGTIDVDLPKMGADPKHKDIFVELDHMTGHEISNDAINKVIAAFDAAPVDNPDGTQGIKLHVDNGPDSIMDPVVAGGTVSGKTWGSLSQADELGHIDLLGTTENGEYDWSAFRSLEQRYFSASRRPVFHYAISAHDFVASHASGISAGGYPSGAGEFLITLGGACPADPCTPKVGMQAGTFMHELGHNLGLGHGGGDHLNYKPNYLSIMNYRFQFSGLKVGGRAGLYDYSRFGPDEIAQIYEGTLHETFGLGTPGPILRDYTTTWSCRDGSIKSATVNAAMDWNCNGVYDSDEVSVNLNGDVDSAGQGIFSVLAPFDDWSHLVFTGGAIGKLGAGLPSEPQRTEADEAPMSVLLTFAHALDPANFPLADTTPPTVRCASADGAWHASDVGLGCTATDAGSGLANAGDASFSLSTHVAGGTETSDAQTESRSVCDVAGNCATAGPIGGNKVDKKAPEIAITLPVDGAVYQLGQNVNGVYSCTDGGAGLGGCVGPVASGAAIDTASVGSKTFAVDARDAVGNTARRLVAYAVAFRVCLLFDPTRPKNAGSTIPVKLQLCDARGANVSSASLPVTAINVDAVPAVASGNANPGNAFRFDATLAGGGYIYNLSTKGLSSGAHTLTFSAAGDPTLHPFDFLLG